MSNKRVLALTLTIIAVLLLAVPVRRSAARTALSASPYCVYAGFHKLDCQAYAEGGTGSYTFQWSPTPLAGGGSGGGALIGCGTGYTTVYVTVTDSSGATFSASTTGYCGGSPAE